MMEVDPVDVPVFDYEQIGELINECLESCEKEKSIEH